MAGAVRQPIDVPSLSKYINRSVSGIRTPVSLQQFSYGQSNPTYQITDACGHRFVLRKKPPGKLVSKSAHQVEREYRIIHALEDTDVPVPKTYCLCEDERVIGTPFYVMEFLDGRIFEDPSFSDVKPDHRREMWHDALRTLAKLHRISPASIGLSTFGKPSSFYNRQIKTLSAISTSQAATLDIETRHPVGKIPHFDSMVSFFQDPTTQPKDRTTLIHGDYKIDNLVYHRIEPRVIGILDWEMSTIGHPLSDLSNILFPYIGAPAGLPGSDYTAFVSDPPTDGLPTRAECITLYAQVAGWDPSREQAWGDAFGAFRNSVIMQGIAARHALRQASSAKAQEYARQMKPFAEFAWALVKTLLKTPAAKAKL